MRMLLSQWINKQNAHELVSRLRRENRSLRAEVKRLSVYKELAYKDDLTRLYNRRFFNERLNSELARAQRAQAPLSVVMIDLDRFKAINDRAGHLVGDEVLRFIGRFLQQICRASDVPCRLGGDEFALILPDTDAEGAQRMAQRLLAELPSAEGRPELPEGLCISFSVGTSTYPPEGQTPEKLLQTADRAMYQAKQAAMAFHSGPLAARP